MQNALRRYPPTARFVHPLRSYLSKGAAKGRQKLALGAALDDGERHVVGGSFVRVVEGGECRLDAAAT